jgi:uncharacterized membrane protein YvbJ
MILLLARLALRKIDACTRGDVLTTKLDARKTSTTIKLQIKVTNFFIFSNSFCLVVIIIIIYYYSLSQSSDRTIQKKYEKASIYLG